MGYLTTFTIYNDGIDLIKENSDEFCEKLYRSAIKQHTTEWGHGNHANLVTTQRSRHADDLTIYVHKGNCLTEVNPYSKEFEELFNKVPDFAKSLVSFMDQEVKELKEKIKKWESDE